MYRPVDRHCEIKVVPANPVALDSRTDGTGLCGSLFVEIASNVQVGSERHPCCHLDRHTDTDTDKDTDTDMSMAECI